MELLLELFKYHLIHPNNEAQKNISKIQSHFVAPWARGYGLAKAMIDMAIEIQKKIINQVFSLI